jgi:hypothetical protein
VGEVPTVIVEVTPTAWTPLTTIEHAKTTMNIYTKSLETLAFI